MNKLIQYIQVLFDPTTRAAAVQQAQQLGTDIGSKIRQGITNQMNAAKAALHDVLDGLKEGWERAMPFAVGELAARAVEMVIEKVRELIGELQHLALESQRLGIELHAIFGESKGDIEAFTTTMSEKAGIARLELQSLMLQIGGMVVGMGMARPEAAKFSEQMAKLAFDLAAFRGEDPARVLEAMQGALVGITRPMHNLGIMVTEDQIKMEAFRETGKHNESQLTSQEKALASLAVMYRLAGPQIGALDRLQGSLGVTTAQNKAAWENMKATLAQGLIPVMAGLQDVLHNNMTAITDLVTILGTVLIGAIDFLDTTLEILITTFSVLWNSIALGGDGAVTVFYRLVEAILYAAEQTAKLAHNDAAAQWLEDQRHAAALAAAEWEKLTKARAAAIGQSAEAFWRAINERSGKVGPQPIPPVVPPPANPDKTKPKTIDQEIATAIQGVGVAETDEQKAARARGEQVNSIRERSLQRLRDLEKQVSAETVHGLDAEIQQAERLHKIRQAIASAAVEELDATLRQVSSLPESIEKFQALMKLREEAMKIRDDPNATQEQRDAAEKEVEAIRKELTGIKLPTVAAGVFDGIISGSVKVKDAMQMIIEGAGGVNAIMSQLGKGGAKSMLHEISLIARGKALENLAQAIEYTAHGIWEASHGNPQASGSFKAAGTAFVAAAKWGAVAGVTGAMSSGASSSGAGAGYDRTGGVTADQSKPAGPTIELHIDGVNPNDPAHRELIGEAQQKYAHETGGTLIVNGSRG